MTREHLLEAVELRPVNIRLADGSLRTITKPEDVTDDIVFESIEEIYRDGFDELSERVVLKRRYGASPEVAMNSHGPLRNDILEFIGNKFVTEGELNAFFNQLEEARGKKLNYKKWFNENQKFFESYTLKGTKVWSLSKIGKRAFEHVIERRSGSNPISERTVLGYQDFALNEELSIQESVTTPTSAKTVQKVIELTLKSVKPEVTEDEVVKRLAAINDLESLYTAAVKLISSDQVNQFRKHFPVNEGKRLILEGHSGCSDVLTQGNPKTVDDAVKTIKSWLGDSDDETFGKFRGVKVVSASSLDQLSDKAEKYEDEQVLVAEIDGKICYAYWTRD